MTLLANARMYSVSPAAKAAWRTLIEWAAQHAAVPIQFVEHEPPLLLSDLWSRDDLGIVQMCGLPASLRDPSPTLIAAPIPTPTRYAGRSVYMSDLAVHVDSPFQTLADTFGGTAGYTLKDSQSGYFAFRYLLLDKYPQAQYKKIVGHLMNARGIIKALVAGEIDVGPLDGYVFDLIRAGDPAFAAQVRIVEQTTPTPMPPLICTAPLEAAALARLRGTFLSAHQQPAMTPVLQTLLIDHFILPEIADYAETRRRAERVEHDGAPWP